jgi:Flp pilus assembly protein TadD
MSAPEFARRPPGVPVALALALGVATLLLYAPVLRFDFIRYDDPRYVLLQPRISQGLTWDNVRWALTAFQVGNWHPLTLISHMTDVSLFGMRAGAHHAVNALLHALNAALLFLFFDSATGRRMPSLAVAGFFAVHPLNVESVAWISQRKSVLCMFFLLLTLMAYLAWVRRGGAARYAIVIAACAAALAAKPIAVVLPGVLLLVDCWPLGRIPFAAGARARGIGRLLLEKAPFAALAVAASIANFAAQEEGGALGSLRDYPAAERAAHTIFAFAWYLVRMIWPSDLSLFYPTTLGSGAAFKVAGSAIFLVAVTIVVVRSFRSRRYLAVGWAWYVLTLVPVVGLVKFGTQIVADRYAYFALIGPLAALAFLVADLLAARPTWARVATVAATGVAIVALAFGTGYALAPWRDSVSILSRGYERAPDNAHAQANLGLEFVKLERFEEGIALLTRAAEAMPHESTLHGYLGYAYAKIGRLAEARDAYETARRLRPDDAGLAMELGGVLAQMDLKAEAETSFREAVGRDPELANAWLSLGTLLQTEGRFAEADPALERAVALLPHDPRSLTAWGVNLEELGRHDDAIATLRKAVHFDPGYQRARTELQRIEAVPLRQDGNR